MQTLTNDEIAARLNQMRVIETARGGLTITRVGDDCFETESDHSRHSPPLRLKVRFANLFKPGQYRRWGTVQTLRRLWKLPK
jgi:hypothetical protein